METEILRRLCRKGCVLMIHVYYGFGKGKTTAAAGLAVRAAGSGLRVMFVQFLKSEDSGERRVLETLNSVSLTPCPDRVKFTFEMTDQEKRLAASHYRGIFERSATLALTERYDMIVLDEVFDAIETAMLSEADVMEFVSNAPGSIEIVMTGHSPSQRFIEAADYATEFKKVKHPFDKGVAARKGVEF